MVLQCCTLLVFVLIFVGLIFQDISTKTTEDKDIPLEGTWEEGRKSPLHVIPAIASIRGRMLSIHLGNGCSDVIIKILENKIVVYEQEVILSSFQDVYINLGALEIGYYTLELSNPHGDRLSSDFEYN